MSKIHIGKKIQEVLNKTPLTVVAFAKSVNLTRDGVYKLFQKDTINILQLQKISKVLNHDFFSYYNFDTSSQTTEITPDYGFATKEELDEVKKELQVMRGILEKLSDGLLGKAAKAKKTSAGNKAYVKPRKKKD
jgi:hypothetical protein